MIFYSLMCLYSSLSAASEQSPFLFSLEEFFPSGQRNVVSVSKMSLKFNQTTISLTLEQSESFLNALKKSRAFLDPEDLMCSPKEQILLKIDSKSKFFCKNQEAVHFLKSLVADLKIVATP